ncbi:MAG: enoyl-CoA hydratase [Gammaproteobacteria bacterium]|nr:enoyl-CoA hydratase [Gammaproteobacteria bacterium]
MNYKTFTLEIADNKVAHLRFNRPEAYNSLNMDFWQEFPTAIRHLDQQSLCRVLVISGEGKHFSAGMDLGVFSSGAIKRPKEAARRNEHLRQIVLQLQSIISSIEQARFPVLAAIQGGCIGGALDLVCACDCRYMSADAFASVEEAKLGLAADIGSLQRLPKLIGDGLARELAYTARRMPAEEALQWRLVNQVFDDAESLINGVMDIAAQMAKHSPMAIYSSKENLNYSRDHSVTESLRYQATWQAGMFQPEGDMMAALMGKGQKTEADYKELQPSQSDFVE